MMNQYKFRGEKLIWNIIIWSSLLTKLENVGIKISSDGKKEVSPSCLIKKIKSDEI